MRITTLVVAAVFVGGGLVPRPPAAPAGPCVTSTLACTAWINPGRGPGRTMVYTTHPLDDAQRRIKRALIMVHGTNRNADHYFATATAAAFLAGALDEHHRHCAAPGDCRATRWRKNEIAWPSGGDSWRSGGMSPSHPGAVGLRRRRTSCCGCWRRRACFRTCRRSS